MYVLTAEQMKTADQITQEMFFLPAEVLMERAALKTVSAILLRKPNKVLVVAGAGNNGADGFAIARILLENGIMTDVLLASAEDKYQNLAKKQMLCFQQFGGKIVARKDLKEYDVIIDAIIGIGFKGMLKAETEKLIQTINVLHEQGSYVIAVDIPSGVNTDTGEVDSIAVQADETQTFAYLKRGLCLYPGVKYSGKVTVAGIGITDEVLKQAGINPQTFSLNKDDMAPINGRNAEGNKGTFGSVLIIAGSKQCYGACYLAAMAAYRSGAGLIRVITHDNNRELINSKLPEAVVTTYNEGLSVVEMIKENISHMKCIVLGPGLGTDKTAESLVEAALTYGDCPIVLDADAINIIALEDNLRRLLQKKAYEIPLILTPHPLELSRFIKLGRDQIHKDYLRVIQETAKDYHVILVGKGAGTIVSDGDRTYINRTGNSGMATAGSGDVLSGIIASLIAQGNDAFTATVAGTFLHGKCGDYAVEHENNEYSLMAFDLIDALKHVMTTNTADK